MTKGHNAREIGERLGIGEQTIKTHQKNVRRKLKARNNVNAVYLFLKALRKGIIE